MSEWVISNEGDFIVAIDTMIAALTAETERAMSESGEIVVRAARLQFNGQHAPGTPRTAGGNRPQNVTGALSNSIHVLEPPIEVSPHEWKVRVAPTMVYGRRVELGFTGMDSIGRDYTPHRLSNGNMSLGGRPYPYLAPGFEKSKSAISATFAYRWAQALAV